MDISPNKAEIRTNRTKNSDTASGSPFIEFPVSCYSERSCNRWFPFFCCARNATCRHYAHNTLKVNGKMTFPTIRHKTAACVKQLFIFFDSMVLCKFVGENVRKTSISVHCMQRSEEVRRQQMVRYAHPHLPIFSTQRMIWVGFRSGPKAEGNQRKADGLGPALKPHRKRSRAALTPAAWY